MCDANNNNCPGEDRDYCPLCVAYREWDGERCVTCGYVWVVGDPERRNK